MVIWKQHITHLINKIIAGLLCFLLILVLFCPATAIAAETAQKTVRVGYYVNDQHEEDTQIVGEDLSTLSGKKIGVIKNTTMEDYLRKWLADHPLDAEIIEFD